MDIGFAGAFLGGLLTLLSPCSVMLLPAFFSYAFARPAQLLARTGVFYLGLITTLVPLGVLAGTLGAFVTAHRSVVVTVASVIVIALGALMALGGTIPMLRVRAEQAGDRMSALAVYVLGTVYGLAGVCAGPLLGATLTLAGLGGNALYGGIVLLIFAAGMIVPLLVLALAWARIPAIRRLVRPREIRLGPIRTTWTALIGGLLTIGIGVLLLVTEGTAGLRGVLGASQQIELEAGAARLAGAIPDWVIVVTVLAIAGVAWGGTALLRRSRRPERS